MERKSLFVFVTAGALRGSVLTLVLFASACAPRYAIPPAPAELREEGPQVEIVVMPFEWSGAAEKPLSGAGAGMAYGLANGALLGTAPAFICGAGEPITCALGLLASVVTIPVGGVVGATAGAAIARPEEEVEAAASRFLAIMNATPIDEQLAYAVQQNARKVGVGRVTLYEEEAGTRPEGPHQENPGESIRLVVQIDRLEMALLGKLDPDVVFTESVTATAFRAGTSSPFFARRWVHESRRTNFFDSLGNEGLLLKAVIAESQQALAGTLVEQTFLWPTPFPLEAKAKKAGVETVLIGQSLIEQGQKSSRLFISGPAPAKPLPEPGASPSSRAVPVETAVPGRFGSDAEAAAYYAELREREESAYRLKLADIAADSECISALPGPSTYRKCVIAKDRARRERDSAMDRIDALEKQGLRWDEVSSLSR